MLQQILSSVVNLPETNNCVLALFETHHQIDLLHIVHVDYVNDY